MWRPGWRWKAIAQQVFSVAPGGDHANWAFQRYVTRGYPASDASLRADLELGRHHVDTFTRHGAVSLAEARLFEFGAGWDLAIPLILRSLGARRQLIVDLRPVARIELVRDMARRIALPMSSSDDLHQALSDLGITYRAPADARNTGAPTGSIDLITSTNTLEHIPAPEIEAILRECHRLLAPGGVMSFQIDYKDHYSYFDPSITPYSFLRYSPKRWKIYNPALHYQNRLRHPDYLAMIEHAGFEILDGVVTPGSDDDIATVRSLPPHPTFSHAASDIAIRESRLTIKKKAL